MAGTKPILTAIIGLLILASLIGYSGENIIDDVPKPDAGLCGVTKDSYSDVPGDGAIWDIEVDVSWNDDTVWIGIIDTETYDSLEKLGGNDDGELVSCDAKVSFVAGGPKSGEDSSFSWTPDGEEFHIMIGSMEEADEDDDDDDGNPWPFDNTSESQTFIDSFTATVEYDASGGWGTILILLIIEMVLTYFVLLERR